MSALASSTFATVQLLRESAAVSRKQPRRAGVLGSTFAATQLGLNARSFTARKKHVCDRVFVHGTLYRHHEEALGPLGAAVTVTVRRVRSIR